MNQRFSSFRLVFLDEVSFNDFNPSVVSTQPMEQPCTLSGGNDLLPSLPPTFNKINLKKFQISPLKILTNVISGFLALSVPYSTEKRKFVLEQPYGKSLTSVEALQKINQMEKTTLKRKK